MLGVAVLYGVNGGTAYADLHAAAASGQADEAGGAPTAAVIGGMVFVMGGLLFKAGAVPGHFWVPDASQGASATAAAYLTTVPKIGALLATARLVEALPAQDRWRLTIAVIAAVTMTLGNLAAYPQTDPRRLLGWSTVSQVGYALVPVAVLRDSDLATPALLLYLTAYTVTNIGAFAVTAALPDRRSLEDWTGLIRSRPVLAVSLVVLLLGLVGTPPTGIFVGKLGGAAAAWDGGTAWLAVVLLVNTVASLFYYLRWIAPAVSPGAVSTTGRRPFVAQRWASVTVVTAAVISVLIGLGAGLLWDAFDVAFLG
jgi:NADH-quinone oxidoreductase subunit N